jgi:energy-coupling factor transporter ATP-binding protein EcfA2
MAVNLRNKPLLDTAADASLFVEPPELLRIDAALSQGLNVAVLGGPGSGKTTLLRQLTHRLREQGRPVVFVSAQHADDAAEALRVVREELAHNGAVPKPLAGAARQSVDSGRPEDLVRTLEIPADEPTVVVLDDISAQAGHELFGRLRDILWQAPIGWLIAARSEDRGLLAAPADAFFEVIVDLEPLPSERIGELLRRRLGDDAGGVPLPALADASRGNPRRALELARAVVIDGHELTSVLTEQARHEARASELGRASSMLLSEIQALGRAVSASDEELLRRMGWTRNRAVQVLGQLEHAGLLHSYAGRGPRGGTAKMYSIDRGAGS